MENEEYEPYGPEWVAQLMKLPKKAIIEFYKNKCIAMSGFDALLDTMNDQAKKEFDKLKADNFFLENEKDGLIQENKKLRDEIQDLKDEMRVQSELNDPE